MKNQIRDGAAALFLLLAGLGVGAAADNGSTTPKDGLFLS
jgi:hypothetical protein